jgi:hypothetical protein
MAAADSGGPESVHVYSSAASATVPLEQIDEHSRLFHRSDRVSGPFLRRSEHCFSEQSTRSSRFSGSIRLLRWRLVLAVPDEFASLEATFSAGILGGRRTAIGAMEIQATERKDAPVFFRWPSLSN